MKDSSTLGNIVAIIVVVVVIVLLGGFVYWQKNQPAESEPVTVAPVAQAPSVAPVVEATPEPAPMPEPTPLAEDAEPTPPEPTIMEEPAEPAITLPPLNESDAFVSEQLTPIANADLVPLIVPDEIVRKTVRAIIGVADNRLVNQYRPVLSPLPTLGVNQLSTGPDAEYELTQSNYQRYDKHIALMQSIDPVALAANYQLLEPMFEEAYAEQGLEGDFREILISAIDNLLAAPDINGPLRLKRPAVMYKYADPAIEALPEPQKLMLRIGPDNRAKVEKYLRAFRDALLNDNM